MEGVRGGLFVGGRMSRSFGYNLDMIVATILLLLEDV